MKSELDQYYREHGRKVYLYLMTLCGEPDTAEELTQETFYQAMKHLGRYDGRSSVFTWLCGIAKHLWQKELTRRTRHPSAEPDESRPDTAPSPDQIAELRDEKQRVLQKLHALPEAEKELILLRATAGLSFREIGALFGKTENWARVTFYRVKQKLKEE